MENGKTFSLSRLLLLPAEIRLLIYHYVLVKGRIRIQSHALPPPQPGVLQVSRQLRRETQEIYYIENEFKWYIRDFDARTFLKWSRSSDWRKRANHVWSFRGDSGWDNLLKWLEAAYHRHAACPGELSPDSVPTTVGLGATALQIFGVTRQMRKQGLSWEQVKANLEIVRLALTAANR